MTRKEHCAKMRKGKADKTMCGARSMDEQGENGDVLHESPLFGCLTVIAVAVVAGIIIYLWLSGFNFCSVKG